MGPRLPRGVAYLHAAPVVTLYGQSPALLIGPRRGGFGPTLRYRMIAAFGQSDGTFGTPSTLDKVARLVATDRFDPPTNLTGADEPARPTDLVAGPRQWRSTRVAP